MAETTEKTEKNNLPRNAKRRRSEYETKHEEHEMKNKDVGQTMNQVQGSLAYFLTGLTGLGCSHDFNRAID